MVEAEFSISGAGVAPERAIRADRRNGTRDFINDLLNGTRAGPALVKKAGADKTVF